MTLWVQTGWARPWLGCWEFKDPITHKRKCNLATKHILMPSSNNNHFKAHGSFNSWLPLEFRMITVERRIMLSNVLSPCNKNMDCSSKLRTSRLKCLNNLLFIQKLMSSMWLVGLEAYCPIVCLEAVIQRQLARIWATERSEVTHSLGGGSWPESYHWPKHSMDWGTVLPLLPCKPMQYFQHWQLEWKSLKSKTSSANKHGTGNGTKSDPQKQSSMLDEHRLPVMHGVEKEAEKKNFLHLSQYRTLSHLMKPRGGKARLSI